MRDDSVRTAIHRVHRSQPATTLLGAAAVGGLTGGGVVLFSRAVDVVLRVCAVWVGDRGSGVERLSARALITGTAVAAASYLWHWVGRGDDGFTVPAVQLAAVRSAAVIAPGRAAGRTLAAALTMGGGGSVGGDGPAAVLGAAIGSRLARACRWTPERARVLVGAGAAAGIAAVFNAPLTGAFFALEAVLGWFQVPAFAPIVLASLIGAFVSHAALGDRFTLALPHAYGHPSFLEVGVGFPMLGVLCGTASALFVRVYFGARWAVARARRALRDRHPWLPTLLPWVAGSIVGALVFASAGRLIGGGHPAVPLGASDRTTWWMLVLLSIGQIVATTTTLQGGGSGGLLTPSLFVGAATGGALGEALHALLPGVPVSPETYGAVGMGAVVAGATGAPITGVLLVVELTHDSTLVLPLVVAVLLSHLVTRALVGETLYSGWLRRRGVHLEHGADRLVLAGLLVADVCELDPEVLDAVEPVASVRRRLIGRRHDLVFPVVDAYGRFLGVVTSGDLRARAHVAPGSPPVQVAGDLARLTETLAPYDSLLTAVRRMGIRGATTLPVVVPASGRFVGVVHRANVFAHYDHVVTAHASGWEPQAIP